MNYSYATRLIGEGRSLLATSFASGMSGRRPDPRRPIAGGRPAPHQLFGRARGKLPQGASSCGIRQSSEAHTCDCCGTRRSNLVTSRRGVRKDGVETTLGKLYDAGVYVTGDEFKGRKPIRRGALEFPVRPRTSPTRCWPGTTRLRPAARVAWRGAWSSTSICSSTSPPISMSS